ncbi:MAG TPA: NAD(P)-dependent oxidoreductase [Roseiarcus sp.]|nr:NAD(P)-dependent oxidoreductase [Roseiarcus sp.]
MSGPYAARKIGWIGMGKMGLPICKRLKGAGFRVTVLCRSGDKEGLAIANGFEIARTVGDAVTGADFVLSAVSDDRALLDVALGEGGLKDSLTGAQIYVDASTVSPAASAQVAGALAPVGCAYLRAPVSGSTATAEQGALTALVSGPANAFRAMTNVFAAFTRKAFLVGEAEEARYLKLAINALVGATSALLAESLALGRRGGLDTKTIMDVVAESAVGSPLIQYKRAAVTTGDYTAAFSVSQMLKDLDLIAAAAAATSCPMPLIESIRGKYQAAVARGLGDLDYFVLAADDR